MLHRPVKLGENVAYGITYFFSRLFFFVPSTSTYNLRNTWKIGNS